MFPTPLPVMRRSTPCITSTYTILYTTSYVIFHTSHSIHHTPYNQVTDYVPRKFRFAARAAVLGSTIIAAAGLLKLSFHGEGVTSTVKGLWAKKEEKK
ncbi:hypothetical protein EON63_18385 [archaeon]|nr:MAG: hypothetical protein EON63_18385 [archaeon]